jgi:hypothetical protein
MSQTDSDPINFYRQLPAVPSFAEATQGRLHTDVPKDWWIVIADVAGSTKAIEAGAYKNVNTVGVACIAAVVNVDRDVDLPFIFGGDGATFAIPDVMQVRVMNALRAAQQLARTGFDLELRVGLVRVGELVEQGFLPRVGKLQLSPHVMQPVLSGRGWEEAERRVKSPGFPGVVRVTENNGLADGSFEGFECRWKGVPSFNGHKLSLLIAAMSRDAAANHDIYQRVFEQIQSIYGDVAQYHPLRGSRMYTTFNPRLLYNEWRVRSGNLGIASRLGYFARMMLQNCVGVVLFARNIDTREVRWSHYRDEVVENSDFRKFDGMLRMVMDGSDVQTEQLQAYLEGEYRAGQLVYGMHKSREALVTCIVQSYNGNHQHFVDGSDGGYALAARELKHRLSTLTR